MKKLIAIIVSFIMAFSVCAVAVSAADVGEYVHWQIKTDGAYVMKLDGKLSVGETVTLTSNNLDYNAGIYYELEIPEDGCYKVTCDAEEYHISETYAYSDYYDTDMACGYEEYALNDDGSRVYYFKKGTLLFSAENYDGDDIKETGAIVTVEKFEGERPEATYDSYDYIEDIVISDLEYCTVSYEYYDGTYSFADPRENGKKIEVSKKKLKDALVMSGSAPYYPEMRELSIKAFSSFFTNCADYRRFGAAVLDLCFVASGKAELFYEVILQPWDYAAGMLIVEEAGGKVTDMEGNKLKFNEPCSILASNNQEDYLKYLN